MIYALLKRYFWACSNWPMFNSQLELHQQWLFLNKIYTYKKEVPKFEKKHLQLTLLYLGAIFLQTRTNCKKRYLIFINDRLFLKVNINSIITFASKTLFPKFLNQVLFIIFIYKLLGLSNESYYRKCFRHCATRSGKLIGILLLSDKMVQPRKNYAVCLHLSSYNYSSSLEDFSILCHHNIKYLLELKGSFFITRDKIRVFGTCLAVLCSFL